MMGVVTKRMEMMVDEEDGGYIMGMMIMVMKRQYDNEDNDGDSEDEDEACW